MKAKKKKTMAKKSVKRGVPMMKGSSAKAVSFGTANTKGMGRGLGY